jgi:uncharacterized protein Usg
MLLAPMIPSFKKNICKFQNTLKTNLDIVDVTHMHIKSQCKIDYVMGYTKMIFFLTNLKIG